MPHPGGSPAPEWLLGVDFSCAPSARKPIVAAWGRRQGSVVLLERVDTLPTLDGFAGLLADGSPKAPGSWLGGFDFPFGLPRAFVDALLPPEPPAPPTDCRALIAHLTERCRHRQGFQQLVDAWGREWGVGTRPATLPHRRCDTAMPGVSSTSPLQTRYVPVGKMYFEGLSRLVAAGVDLPALAPGRATATALEAYPGLLAHELLGRQSYKSDASGVDAAKLANLLMARLSLVNALETGQTRLGLRLKLGASLRDQLVGDVRGDRLDAVLCLMQAAWAHAQHDAGHAQWGLPTQVDPVEGWILTA